MEDRRGALRAQVSQSERPKLNRSSTTGKESTEEALRAQVLADLQKVISAEDVPESVKRDLLATIVDKVICQKEGAVIVFLPGAMPVPEEADQTVQVVKTNTSVKFMEVSLRYLG